MEKMVCFWQGYFVGTVVGNSGCKSCCLKDFFFFFLNVKKCFGLILSILEEYGTKHYEPFYNEALRACLWILY